MASAYLPTVFLSICSRFTVGSNGVPYHRLTTGGGACQKWQLGVFAHGCYLAIALESRAGYRVCGLALAEVKQIYFQNDSLVLTGCYSETMMLA